MVSSQWEALKEKLSVPAEPTRLIDYGCGQGLAGLLLYDRFGQAFPSALSQVVLIEPSAVALVRAEAVYRAIAPRADTVCINKQFDDIGSTDFENNAEHPILHVFSNVLDIAGFNHFQLFGNALSMGKHFIFAISPDRDFDGGTSRLRDLEALFKNPEFSASFADVESELTTFKCGDKEQYPAVSWLAKFEVVHG